MRRSLLVAALVLASLGLAAPAHAAASEIDYVALGDSYSSGVGATGQSGACKRGTRGYPALWAQRNAPKSYRLVACTGADTDDVKADQIPALSDATDLVTITVGGNDSGFVPALATCTLTSDSVCAGVVNVAKAYMTGPLGARLDSTFAAIKARAPRARVVVLGYPRLFETSPSSCGVLGLSQAKRRAVNSGADQLDQVVKARAEAAGFTFGDVRGPFGSHGICGSSPWLNGLQVTPPGDSFHPNATGYANGYLPVLTAALS